MLQLLLSTYQWIWTGNRQFMRPRHEVPYPISGTERMEEVPASSPK